MGGGRGRSMVDLLRERAQEGGEENCYLFLERGETPGPQLSFRRLQARARSIGARLQAEGCAGRRVMLLYPPGLDFLEGFFGSLFAAVAAVPAYPPRSPRKLGRLRALAKATRPAAVLTVADELSRVQSWFSELNVGSPKVIAGDLVADREAEAWRPPSADPSSVAFLQFTSGSTATPRGVVVTHGNLLSNLECIDRSLVESPDNKIVSWLPVYHDFGLIFGALYPLFKGLSCVQMSPFSFLQKPVRWLSAIDRFGGTHSAAPCFAYDLCVRAIRPELRGGLDLSGWRMAASGGEPVRREVVDRFTEAFRPCGFRRSAFTAAYGLAEATLKVSAIGENQDPAFRELDAERLGRGVCIPPSDPACKKVSVASCGIPDPALEVAVVDPDSGAALAEDRVGEIWVAGPSVAAGYWKDPAATRKTFGGRLAGRPHNYLRTGDLGFLHDGHLFVTGRIKDLLIIAGENVYPQDLEAAAEAAHPAVIPHSCAAFSLEGEGPERLVLIAETRRRPPVDKELLGAAIRRAVSEEFGVRIHEVVLLGIGQVPKTSSGKIQRGRCRSLYLEGAFEVVEPVASGGGS